MFNREWAKRQKDIKDKKDDSKGPKVDKMEDEDEDDDDSIEEGSRTIVVHFGSKNLRVGLSTDVLPKTVPNVIAHRVGDDYDWKNERGPYDPDTEAFNDAHKTVYRDFRERMKFYKRRILPNSHDICVGFNSRSLPESIPEHNDPYRVEWTDVAEEKKKYYTGHKAVKIPPDSSPKYKLRWPIQHGLFNEEDYSSPQEILGDISLILMDALEEELQITFKSFPDYKVVFIIPDLYDRNYVVNIIQLLFEMGFSNVCIFQESMAATYGAGVSTACVIDVGAQKTSIACVEEGMVIPDSRVCLRFGGDDVSTALAKLFVKSSFPYRELDLRRQFDKDLMDELKVKFATTNDADVAVQLYSFFQHSPGQPGNKYQFKTFDEVMLAPLGLFYPQLFEMEGRLQKRYSLFPPSMDIYEDNKPADGVSDAQINVYKGTLATQGQSYQQSVLSTNTANTPGSSLPGTPAPEAPPGAKDPASAGAKNQELMQIKALQEINHNMVPEVGLEHAIIESITQASAKSLISTPQQAFYENLMIVGGGGQFPGFNNLLADRIAMWRQASTANDANDKNLGEISIMPAPREMDPQLLTWKGGVVFSKLKICNEVWLTPSDWEMFGSRGLQYKAHFII